MLTPPFLSTPTTFFEDLLYKPREAVNVSFAQGK